MLIVLYAHCGFFVWTVVMDTCNHLFDRLSYFKVCRKPHCWFVWYIEPLFKLTCVCRSLIDIGNMTLHWQDMVIARTCQICYQTNQKQTENVEISRGWSQVTLLLHEHLVWFIKLSMSSYKIRWNTHRTMF